METAKLNFVHLCDYASPGEGGKLNVLGIFENIFSHTNNFIHPQLYIVTNVSIKKSGNLKQIIKIVRERDSAEIIKSLEFNISIQSIPDSKEAKIGFIGQFNSIKFEEFGNYVVQIFIDSEKLGEVKLSVSQIPQAKIS